MQTFREFVIHKTFELIRTAYRASFPDTNCTADGNQLTQFSAAGFGKDINTYLVSVLFSTKDMIIVGLKQHKTNGSTRVHMDRKGNPFDLCPAICSLDCIDDVCCICFFSPASQPSLTSLVSDEFLDASVEANEKEVGGR